MLNKIEINWDQLWKYDLEHLYEFLRKYDKNSINLKKRIHGKNYKILILYFNLFGKNLIPRTIN